MKDVIDFPQALPETRPVGIFVHHQGRGHAERVAALANALPEERPVRLFCARDDIFPTLRPGVEVSMIPSLFERPEGELAPMDWVPTPDTLHCAPLGWRSIRQSMALLTDWFLNFDPALMIVDVSAEVAQLARICSVPHVMVMQHGDRVDPGHRAAYDGAAGLLAPFHEALAQPCWEAPLRARMHFAPGLGVPMAMPAQSDARQKLGLGDRKVAVVVTGDGGSGITEAPLGIAARTFPEIDWVVFGRIQGDWHATLPANLRRLGWIDNAADWIAAADLVVASTGNTTCHQILAAGRPWIAVPEWRYFDEQLYKAEALAAAGAALHLPNLPGSAHRWREAVRTVLSTHDSAKQTYLAGDLDAAPRAAAWVEDLIARLWAPTSALTATPERMPT